MGQETPGYEIPCHSALSEPITIAGAPRSAAILIGTLTAVLSLGLQAPWIGLPLGGAVYGVVVWATRRDAYALAVLARHARQHTYFDS